MYICIYTYICTICVCTHREKKGKKEKAHIKNGEEDHTNIKLDKEHINILYAIFIFTIFVSLTLFAKTKK